MKPIALLPLALAALLLAPLAGAAEAEEDTAWRLEARELDVRDNPSGFTFTSRRDSALGTDTLSGGFDANRAELTTALRADEPEPASLRMSVAWASLVEYRDADGDGQYGLADETVQEVAIAPLPHQTAMTPVLGGGRSVTVVYALPENASDDGPVIGGLPSPRGSLRLSFTLVPAPGSVGGSGLEPTAVGLATEVRDFPFQAGDTLLAVTAQVSTEAAPLEPQDGALAAATGRHSWVAAWTPRATTDGSEVLAGWAALASDAGHATAVLSLPRGDSVSQDGSVSAHRLRADVVEALRDLPPGDWRFYAVGLAGAAVALGVPSLRRLRER